MAQSDDLYGTWYLVYLEPETGEPPATFVDPIEPAISPQITINEDLTFTGIAACNTYSGQFFYNDEFDILELSSFSRTSDPCSVKAHDDFEFYLFNNFMGPMEDMYEYFIHPTNNTLQLIYNLGFEQFFQDEPLTVTSQEAASVVIYPNPGQDELRIKTQGDMGPIKVWMTDGLGRTRRLKPTGQNIYDTTAIASGFYLVTIESQEGRQHIKWLKR